MNFLYYKNFGEEKTTTPVTTSYKKKKLPPKKQQQGQRGNQGHSSTCECDVCSTQFPLRTHLMLDMSYCRLEATTTSIRRSSGGGVKFSLFNRYKKSLSLPNRDDRRPSTSARVMHGVGAIAEQMAEQHHLQQQQLAQAQAAAALKSFHAETISIATLKQDCFMIPVGRINNFFPAGHQIPTVSDPGRVRMLETADPNIKIVFHMMTPPKLLLPSMDTPLFDPHNHQKQCILKAFKGAAAAMGSAHLQGMVLLNLEREGEDGKVEFPFMVVWIVDVKACDSCAVIAKVRQTMLEALDPVRTGYTCTHFFDSYDEVVTLARPPVEKLSRKANTPSTGYIIGVFRVFEGDDGQKFERNWLSWTGAKTLYKSLPATLGLRRLTLHKSSPQNGILHYVLVCDCANFLTHIARAVTAVPTLRMRLCGDIGLYRPICTL